MSFYMTTQIEIAGECFPTLWTCVLCDSFVQVFMLLQIILPSKGFVTFATLPRTLSFLSPAYVTMITGQVRPWWRQKHGTMALQKRREKQIEGFIGTSDTLV